LIVNRWQLTVVNQQVVKNDLNENCCCEWKVSNFHFETRILDNTKFFSTKFFFSDKISKTISRWPQNKYNDFTEWERVYLLFPKTWYWLKRKKKETIIKKRNYDRKRKSVLKLTTLWFLFCLISTNCDYGNKKSCKQTKTLKNFPHIKNNKFWTKKKMMTPRFFYSAKIFNFFLLRRKSVGSIKEEELKQILSGWKNFFPF